jgi:hypothetical protein
MYAQESVLGDSGYVNVLRRPMTALVLDPLTDVRPIGGQQAVDGFRVARLRFN